MSLELCFVFVLWPPATQGNSFRSAEPVAHELTSPKTNQLHYVPQTVPDQNEVSDSEEREEHHQYDDQLPPTPFQRQNTSPQEPASFVTQHEYQRSAASRHPNHIQHQQPVTNVRRQQSEIYYNKKKFVPDANYFMKAGGKEKFYAQDSTREYRPFGPEPPAPFSDKSAEHSKNKKNSYEKSYRTYKYAYSSNRGEGGPNTPEYSLPEKNYPKFVHPSTRMADDQTPTVDFHAAKSTSWKQLGPNVEISTSADHPVYSKRDSASETSKNTNKKRKGSPKNVRSGYLNQQHALYIANNLANYANLPLRPVKGIFDHNTVMKHSDKFELSDAMFQELEEAKKLDEAQIRNKQELSKDHYHKYQPELTNAYHNHHYQVNPTLLNALPIEAGAYAGKYYQPHPVGAFGKGFIRHIEVETSPSGVKKMIPALIIPLTPDQLNNQFFNHEIGLYQNNPEALNPSAGKLRQGQVMPFETLNSRRLQNDLYENYQYQQVLSPYEYEGYNPHVNYQPQNFYRLPYNLNGVSSTSATVDAKSPETRAALYSAKKKPSHRASPSPSPTPSLHQQQPQQIGPVNRLSQVHPSNNPKVNYKREEYVYDANKSDDYLSASESFTTVASINGNNQKVAEKIENN